VLSRVFTFTVQVVTAVFYILSDVTSNMSYYGGGGGVSGGNYSSSGKRFLC